MGFLANPSNLKLLQDLLREPEENSDSEPDDRLPSVPKKISTPSVNVGQGQSTSTSSTSVSAELNKLSGQELNRRLGHSSEHLSPQTLSEWEEQEALLNDTEFEDRLAPEYRIVYKQSVAPEDIYLRMGNKTAATSSCEEMCLEILLPKETVSIDRMELDVSSNEIDLRTPIYRLKLPLIQPTDPDRGKASWDDKQKILRLTLRMKREYDFINF